MCTRGFDRALPSHSHSLSATTLTLIKIRIFKIGAGSKNRFVPRPSTQNFSFVLLSLIRCTKAIGSRNKPVCDIVLSTEGKSRRSALFERKKITKGEVTTGGWKGFVDRMEDGEHAITS